MVPARGLSWNTSALRWGDNPVVLWNPTRSLDTNSSAQRTKSWIGKDHKQKENRSKLCQTGSKNLESKVSWFQRWLYRQLLFNPQYKTAMMELHIRPIIKDRVRKEAAKKAEKEKQKMCHSKRNCLCNKRRKSSLYGHLSTKSCLKIQVIYSSYSLISEYLISKNVLQVCFSFPTLLKLYWLCFYIIIICYWK